MRGTVYQRCSCPLVKDAAGAFLKDVNGRNRRAHRPRCKPTWGYVFDAGPRPNGRRLQKTKSGFSTRREAERALTEALRSFDKGTFVDTGRLTVGTYLAGWLDGKAALRDTTRRSYESHLRLYLAPALGHRRMTELRYAHVERLFVDLQRRPSPGLSAASLRRIYATLNSALNGAVKHHLVATNHAAHVELPAGR